MRDVAQKLWLGSKQERRLLRMLGGCAEMRRTKGNEMQAAKRSGDIFCTVPDLGIVYCTCIYVK